MDSGDMVDQNLVDRLAEIVRDSGTELKCSWKGHGTITETPLKDASRELIRSAEYDFTFVLDQAGKATGTITLTYDAVLTVDNLPQVGVGVASFSPDVGGRITDPNPVRSFALAGELSEDGLTLEIATAEAERKPIEFTIRADPGVSAGLAAGGATGTLPGRGADVQIIKIDMMPFTPFSGPGIVEVGEYGPFAARFSESGDAYSIEWEARLGGASQAREPVGN